MPSVEFTSCWWDRVGYHLITWFFTNPNRPSNERLMRDEIKYLLACGQTESFLDGIIMTESEMEKIEQDLQKYAPDHVLEWIIVTRAKYGNTPTGTEVMLRHKSLYVTIPDNFVEI